MTNILRLSLGYCHHNSNSNSGLALNYGEISLIRLARVGLFQMAAEQLQWGELQEDTDQ